MLSTWNDGVLNDWYSLYQDGHWIFRVFCVVLVVVLVNLLVRTVLGRLQERVRESHTIWDDAVYDALNPPLRLIVWILGLGIAVDLVEPLPGDELFQFVDPVRRVAIIATLTWFLVRLISKLEGGVLQRASSGDGEHDIDRTTVEAIGKLVRVAVMITATLVILQTLGFSVSGVLAFGGVGGIAIGFAAKDMLANFFGGLTIYLDRPFATGDWIRSPEKEIEGVVEKIGWRTSRIRRFDKRPIYVPNSVFTSIIVENPSRMTNRRIYETIGVRYDDFQRLDGIVEEIRSYLKAHAGIDQKQTMIVNFNQFGASSLDFFVYCLTVTTNWVEYHALKHEVLMHVHKVIAERGGEVAFPTRTLHIPEAVAVQANG